MSDDIDDEYDFEPGEYDDCDVSQQMTSIDTGEEIKNQQTGDYKKLYAFIGPENIRRPDGNLKVLIPNISGDIPEEVAVDALDGIVFSQKYNPFLIDLQKLQKMKEETIKQDYRDLLEIPMNVKSLFFLYTEKLEKPKDVSKELDRNNMPELFGAIDYVSDFGILDLTNSEDIEFVLNHIVPFLLIKLYLKKNRVMFRLMTDVKFGIVDDDETGGKNIVPLNYGSFIEFEPVKRNRSKK